MNWSLSVDTDRIAWLTCDVPDSAVNTLSARVLRELAQRLDEVGGSLPRGLVVRSGKPGGFIAGADIKEFSQVRTPEQGYDLVRAGQAVIQKLADLRCPTVAAVHGYVLGGGLELALACRYRVAADEPSLSLGLPEVLLGIHPGFGGTVRSVRLIGVRAALDLMLKGKPVRAARGLESGLIDELVPRSELDRSSKRILQRAPPARSAPLLDRLLNWAPLRPVIATRATASVRRSAPRDHYPAPYAIVDLWRTHGARGTAAFDAEARSISRLMCTPTSRNLVRVFGLQDRLKGLGEESAAEFNHVHVIGAGTMGGDIAAWSALRGLTVTLQDRSEELIRPALARAAELFAKRLRDPKLAAAARDRLKADVAGEGVGHADVVIEAIVENLEAKRSLYATLEPQLKPGAMLATNTSSITIETLAAQLADPARLVGIHFFNPVAQLPLVEIVRGAATAARTLTDAQHFTRRLDKLPLPCRSAPGFVVNRILTPYVNEAFFALEAGIAAPVIDRAATDFGMPMGPIELTDVVGLDVSLHVGRVLAAALDRKVPALLVAMVERQRLGRKTGQGFYLWRDGKAQKEPVAREAVPDDLQDRLILPMLNEAVACLREGIIDDADLLDAGAIFATGFAPFRGGPMQYAKDRGILNVTSRLTELAQRYGERFRPDVGWDRI
jgi:3-hydroxyacyl-CoA dehydrogenase/enoyl-CoA hydratase/3-hydroxybutyryl-CoA epimerase